MFLIARGPRHWQARKVATEKHARELESAGLIARRVTKSKAIAIEYSLTHRGKTIIATLGGMCRWAKRNRRIMSAEVRLRETETG
jgi:DNA-binding HxlR family transcriptional regulator